MSGSDQEPFPDSANALATTHDILMCYQILLGRDPESAFVIDEARTQPIRNLLVAFFTSEEFVRHVAQPLAAGTRLPHEAWSRGPKAEHVSWFADVVKPDDAALIALRSAKSWRSFIHEVSELMPFYTEGRRELKIPNPPVEESDDELAPIRQAISTLETGLADVQRQLSDLTAYFAALLPEFPDNKSQPNPKQPPTHDKKSD